jgi:hypothetical protein
MVPMLPWLWWLLDVGTVEELKKELLASLEEEFQAEMSQSGPQTFFKETLNQQPCFSKYKPMGPRVSPTSFFQHLDDARSSKLKAFDIKHN